jgi:hypothetical protein
MVGADTAEALTRSVNAMDAARRVGFAKAYAAEESAANAARDLNIARADLAAITKFAAHLYGMILMIPLGADRIPRSVNRAALISMLPDKQLASGRAAGRSCWAPIEREIRRLQTELAAANQIIAAVTAGEDIGQIRKLRRENAALRIKLREATRGNN